MRKTLYILPLLMFLMTSTLLNAQIGPITQICLVTVDSTMTHNVVVWERASQSSTIPIDSMRIYRYTPSGNDSLIATVDYDSLSEYHDYAADPNLRAYTYRISGVDDNGLEGMLSTPHRTIHLTVTDNGSGNLHMAWSPYIGQSVPSYQCWRDSVTSQTIDDLVNSTSSGFDTSWWDNSTPQNWNNLWYKVDVAWSITCTSTRANNHNTTRSNRTQPTSGPTGILNGPTLVHLDVYPNPVSDMVNIKFSSTVWERTYISIYDINGREVQRTGPFRVQGQYVRDIDVSSLEPGMYSLVVRNGYTSVSKRLVVAR